MVFNRTFRLLDFRSIILAPAVMYIYIYNMFHRKTQDFNGHCQELCNKLPEGMSINIPVLSHHYPITNPYKTILNHRKPII